MYKLIIWSVVMGWLLIGVHSKKSLDLNAVPNDKSGNSACIRKNKCHLSEANMIGNQSWGIVLNDADNEWYWEFKPNQKIYYTQIEKRQITGEQSNPDTTQISPTTWTTGETPVTSQNYGGDFAVGWDNTYTACPPSVEIIAQQCTYTYYWANAYGFEWAPGVEPYTAQTNFYYETGCGNGWFLSVESSQPYCMTSTEGFIAFVTF